VSASPPESSWHLSETYKALITLAVEALKILALVNGGAAVAVLTYLGNLVSHVPIGTPTPDMTPALRWYCGGLFVTILAFVVAYVAQLVLYQEELRRVAGRSIPQYHAYLVGTGVVLALLAAIAFAVGCFDAAKALSVIKH
jgi:hypothetical protein